MAENSHCRAVNFYLVDVSLDINHGCGAKFMVMPEMRILVCPGLENFWNDLSTLSSLRLKRFVLKNKLARFGISLSILFFVVKYFY